MGQKARLCLEPGAWSLEPVSPADITIMRCEDVRELVEPIAAGDLTPDAAVSAHLVACAGCTAALDAARQLERLLQSRHAPEAPPSFTSHLVGRIRRHRWQREQYFDIGFNVTVGLVGVAITVGTILLVYITGLSAVGNDIINLFASSAAELVRRAARSLPLYAAATALIATALAIWWWAERDLSI